MVAAPLLLQAQQKILFIGNSFTLGSSDGSEKSEGAGGVPGLFDRLAQAGGQANPTTVMRAVGGTDYQFHATDATSRNTIASQPWDYVILQNYSTEPTHLVDGTHSLADHYTYGTALYQLTLSNNPATQVVLYETWSRAAAHSLITGVSSPTSFASTVEFQTELRTNYLGLANFLNATFPTNPAVTVAPVGDAWENAGGLRAASDPQFVDFFSADNYHGNDNGYYLSACVLYALIYGASPEGLSTIALLSSLNLHLTVPAGFLEQTAWATVNGTNVAGNVWLVREPSSLTVPESQPVTFSVSALGSPPLVYTWFSNNVPITGATQANYTIPAVTTNMNGSFYSVTVSNSISSVHSSNAVLTVTSASLADAHPQTFLFDFGATSDTVEHGPSPDDPVNYWNNITTVIGDTSSGELANLVTSQNVPTGLRFVMTSRFHDFNGNGTTAYAGLPQDGTRDSLYGHTETWSGLANIFPAFKLAGLSPWARYNFYFYASRTGVSDNRETGYTVQGENAGFAALNVANNVGGSATVNGIKPNALGEIAVSLAPTANNNNAYHFTYLGVMKVTVVPGFLPPTVTDNQIELRWVGTGQLEWTADLPGPWTAVTPTPASAFSETVVPGDNRFYRLNAIP
jgi:hypothetical protein